MQKTTSAGSTGSNQFTDGDPVAGTPATIIDAVWLNSVQEEICSVIAAAVPGITLDVTKNNQLLTAIQELIQQGAAPAAYNITIANNQVSAANVAGLLFDNTKIKAARILYSIHRQTDLGVEVEETGQLWAVYQPVSGQWRLSGTSMFDDAGVTFSITALGQIQYASTNLSFTSTYVGQMRIGEVAVINL